MHINDILNTVEKISGTSGRMDYAMNLYKIASRLPDNAIIVEIGSQNGGSAAVFGLTLKERNVKIYCVDPCFVKESERPLHYREYSEIGGYSLDIAIETFNKLKLDKNIICLSGTSKEMLAKWNGEKFDMLYIDGNHTYEAVLEDMMWLRHAKDKCILMLDDWIDCVSRACEEKIESFPGFTKRTDSTFWPMYYTRGY